METVKNPTLIDILVPLLIIVFIIGMAVVLLYQHFQKNLIAHQLKQEALKSSHQSELLRVNIQTQETERKRIAEDIHDELGAVLSIIRMNIVMLEQQSKESAGILPGLQNVRTLTESALTSTRNISHRLMPPQLEAFGLAKTLESVIAKINDTGNLVIQLDVSAFSADLPWTLSLGLYRIIMELINNTIKHSGASEACVRFFEEEARIYCQYTDNGIGLPDDAKETGLGHKSIDGRVNALKGTFEFGTQQTGGFYATIGVPLH